MVENTITDQFLGGILAIGPQDILPETIKKIKFCLLDYIGVVLAGSAVTREKINKLRNVLDGTESKNLAIGIGSKDSLQNAIFFNGINSHILELDDGSRYGVTHPGGPLFSALIPIAFRYHIGWDKFMMGVLTGYETILRISTSIQPSHYNRGYHPTATCTPLGISVGICVMLDSEYKVIKDAFSCACISAGGSLKAIEDTSKMKAINAARAAELGFISYSVAQAGFIGPKDVLAGTTGFLRMMSGSFDGQILIRQQIDRLWIDRVYCKLYASCRHTHGAIEGILRLRDSGIDINEIQHIGIKIYRGIRGKHDSYDIYGEESAKMSIPYSVAAACVYGNANDDIFKAACIANPQVHNLMNKISIEEDDHLSSLLPIKRATETTIFLKDGQTHTILIDYPKGEPENPVELEELRQKFYYLVEKSGKTRKEADKIISVIFSDVPDLTELYKILNQLNHD